jgi:hypothetical protein
MSNAKYTLLFVVYLLEVRIIAAKKRPWMIPAKMSAL